MNNEKLNSHARQSTAEGNRALLRATYEAFARGDIGAVLAILSPAIEWTDAEGFPYAGTYIGPDAVREKIFARIGSEWDRFEAVPSSYIADGAHVVVLGEYRATYKSTGRSVTSPFAHVWRIEDGKVVRFRQFTDSPPFQRAVEQ
jgi:hypothetical protein